MLMKLLDAGKLREGKIFYFVLLLKVLLGSLLASKFLTDLFIPFVEYFVTSGFKDPYTHFFQEGENLNFPYPALMLYLMSLPYLLLGWIAPQSLLLKLFLFRIPLLIADISIYCIFKSWLRERFHKSLIYFYWLSPVLIYISYVHGQLDAIPIALLFASLYYLFKEKVSWSAILLGCALAAKTNVLLVGPFFFLFLISKKVPIKELVYFFLISLLTFVVINSPFLLSPAFLEGVFLNPEQSKLFNPFVEIHGLKIFLIPASLLILFVRGVLLKNYNKDIFIMFLGFAFSIILLFIPPMPGWYFWLIPFLAYFYIQKPGRSPLLFGVLSCFYLLYFFVVKETDYFLVFQNIWSGSNALTTPFVLLESLGLNADRLVSLVYTGLQTTLLVNCFWIYKKGLESYRKQKISASPFLIGIGGNSGVGKTTFSAAISEVFGNHNVTVLRGDDMHKWKRNHEKWGEFTHLDPRANYLHREINYLQKLKSGQRIYRRHYNHATGEFTEERPLSSNNLIIFEGLHPFYLPSQRRLFDLKLFIKPSTELMHHWKIVRDRKKRGYSKEKVLESIHKRAKDTEKYIETQENKADFIVEALPLREIVSVGEESEEVSIYFKLRLSNIVYIEPLVDQLMDLDSLELEHWYTEDDHQIVSLKGDCDSKSLNQAAQKFISRLEDLGIYNVEWPEGLFGAVILILTHYIMEKAKYDQE